MALKQLALPTGSNTGRDGQVANARVINGYVEANGTEAKSPFTIYAAPGLSAWGTGSYDGGVRGMLQRDKDAFVVVAGPEVVTYDGLGTPTLTATLGDTGYVHMARNKKFTAGLPTPQIIMVTASGLVYILEDGVLTQVTDTDLPAPVGVDYLSGFFIFGIGDGRLYCSTVEDGFSIDALAYESINAKYSRLKRILSSSGFLYVWTEKSMEIWQADPTLAAEAFPFSAVNQNIGLGIACPLSACQHSQGNAWVDHNRVVRLGKDSSSQRISNHAVERALSDLSDADLEDVRGFVYSFHGHETYALTSSSWTWQFDGASQTWNERYSYGSARWRPSTHAQFNGADIFGNTADGTLYSLSPSVNTDGGDHIVLEIWCPQSHAFPNHMIVDGIFLDVVSGVGLTTTNAVNSDPHLMLDYSDDGGKNFYGERRISIGKIGEFSKRLRAYRWGTVKEKGRIWRIRAPASVLRGINALWMEARPING
jgi:hypothetical protein